MNTDISLENSIIEQERTENGFNKVSEMLRAGIKAAQEGNRSEARNLLINVTEVDSSNENAWLWLASISEYPEELLVFLRNVLSINPYNERALEWSKATRCLLAKTFVGRGIDAHKQNQHDFAKQCFLQAIVNDDKNEMAWLWLASTTDSFEEKISHLQKVLRINPENETAQASLKAATSQKLQSRMRKANAAAVSGRHDEANEILDEILQNLPDVEDAWILKAYLTNSFDEKLAYFEKVLEINPANETAQMSLNSIRAMKAAVETREEESIKREKESAVVEEDHFDDEIAQPEFSFEQIVEEQYLHENILETQPAEEIYSETLYGDEPLEIAPQMPENCENETFETEEFYKEDFYSQQEEPIDEPLEGIAPAEEEYLQMPAPVVEHQEEYESEEAFEEETTKNQPEIFEKIAEETLEDESFETEEEIFANENIDIYSNGNGSTHLPEIEQTACPFCRAENEVQAFVCGGCNAILTLSDLERLLAHKEADAEMLRRAVERMEVEEVRGVFGSEELTLLGIGCINLKNLPGGLKYLRKAAQLNPNDLLLNSQVNSLAIRLSEIEKQENIHRSMPQDRTILVVDDSATVRKLICSKLEKSGHNVISAVDGVDALEKLKEITPDLVLLDITMPRMDGYQVCKLIRSNPEMKDIPVVMISGKDGFFDKVRGRMAGTTGYITKPFGPETLMKTVEAFVSQSAEKNV